MKKITSIREEEMSLAQLLRRNGFTVQKLSEALCIDKHLVMEWICGKVPASEDCNKISLVLNCPLSMVYEAIVHTTCVI